MNHQDKVCEELLLGVDYNKYTLFDKIELKISRTDLDYLCKNRFFTDKPTVDDIQREFVTGTGITPNKAHLWKDASKRFHEYVNDLRAIEDTDLYNVYGQKCEKYKDQPVVCTGSICIPNCDECIITKLKKLDIQVKYT